jgi:hypothetical protein
MTIDLTGSENATLFPLMGFNVGDVARQVTLRLEFATRRTHLDAGNGKTLHFVMTREAATEIGTALLDQARRAEASGH